jgi:hypothetical protein
MSAFDHLSDTTSLAIANVWKAPGDSLPDANDVSDAFKLGVIHIERAFLACLRDASEGNEPRVEALGNALRSVASDKMALDRLLLLRGGKAQIVLDALQLVPTRCCLCNPHALTQYSTVSR